MKRFLLCFTIALSGAFSASAKDVSSTSDEPFAIAQQGNFLVGGREVEVDGSSIVANSMYVEYQIPADRKHEYPIVFYHGGGPHGSYWWSRPDGGEGWATLFVRKGYAVYVVDRPTFGRSPHFEFVDGPKLMTSGLKAPGGSQVKKTPGFVSRFPGVNEPGDPAYEQQRRRRGQPTIELPTGPNARAISARVDTMDRAAGAALLDRIGPAIIATHSRAGSTGWQVGDVRPDLVKAIVAVEPNGPPFFNPPPVGKPEDEPARPFGLTYAPLAFDPPVEDVDDFGELVQALPVSEGATGCWMPENGVPRLKNLSRIPVLVLTAGASYHAAYDHCTAGFLAAGGVEVEHINLDDKDIRGNTHGMMLESNNAQIADLVEAWLGAEGY